MRLAVFLPRSVWIAMAAVAMPCALKRRTALRRACGLGMTLLALFAASALAKEPAYQELRHSVTGHVTALVNPAAARNHGAPLDGSGGVDRPPSAVLHAGTGARAMDDTVREAGRRFGLGEPERELVSQGATLDGLRMVNEKWEQRWQGVPVYGAGLIVHRNAQGRSHQHQRAHPAGHSRGLWPVERCPKSSPGLQPVERNECSSGARTGRDGSTGGSPGRLCHAADFRRGGHRQRPELAGGRAAAK